jgi:hypothetical protein
MRKHDIAVVLPAHRVVNADLGVTVNGGGQRLGELLISEGTLDCRTGEASVQGEHALGTFEGSWSGGTTAS